MIVLKFILANAGLSELSRKLLNANIGMAPPKIPTAILVNKPISEGGPPVQ